MAAPPPPQQQDFQQQGQMAGARGNPGPPQLSPEEQRVLRECNNESFWYRSLPAASVLSFTAHILVKQGVMKPNLRYGAAPKAVLGAIIGYFFGKFSYAESCADKFLVQAPRSKISEVVRVRRGMPPLEIDPAEQQAEQYSGLGVPAAPSPPEYGQQEAPVVAPATSNPNYDEMRAKNREPPVQYRTPSPPIQTGDPNAPPSSIYNAPSPTNPNYDEMRKMNREPPAQYRTPQSGDPNLPPSSIYSNAPPPPPPSLYNPPPSSRSKNKYGDEGFE